MNINRLSVGYEPDFDIDAAVGRQGELFVLDIAEAIRDGRGEVKHDERAAQTGNVFTEYQCLKNGAYVPSCIEATQAEFWTVTFGKPPAVAISAPTRLVRAVHERALREGRTKTNGRGSHPTRGTVVTVAEYWRWLLDANEELVSA